MDRRKLARDRFRRSREAGARLKRSCIRTFGDAIAKDSPNGRGTAGRRLRVVEAALLIEAGYQRMLDRLIVVLVPAASSSASD